MFQCLTRFLSKRLQFLFRCFCFESAEVSVVSVSFRYQRAAEVSSTEKKKGVSITAKKDGDILFQFRDISWSF